MADQAFLTEQFEPFFVEIAAINYKLKTQRDLTDDQKALLKVLRYLIPAANRLCRQPTLSISNIVDQYHGQAGTQVQKQQTQFAPSAPSFYPAYGVPRPPAMPTKQEEDLAKKESDSEDETDEEGDLLVTELTNYNMRLIKDLRVNRFLKITDTHSDSEYDENSEEEEKQEQEQEQQQQQDQEHVSQQDVDMDDGNLMRRSSDGSEAADVSDSGSSDYETDDGSQVSEESDEEPNTQNIPVTQTAMSGLAENDSDDSGDHGASSGSDNDGSNNSSKSSTNGFDDTNSIPNPFEFGNFQNVTIPAFDDYGGGNDIY